MKVKEKVMEIVFLVAACVSILAVLLICVFLFSSGIPAIGKIGPLNFLGGTVWKPSNNLFGILPMILGSIYVTAGAIIIGVPIGIFMHPSPVVKAFFAFFSGFPEKTPDSAECLKKAAFRKKRLALFCPRSGSIAGRFL